MIIVWEALGSCSFRHCEKAILLRVSSSDYQICPHAVRHRRRDLCREMVDQQETNRLTFQCIQAPEGDVSSVLSVASGRALYGALAIFSACHPSAQGRELYAGISRSEGEAG